VARSPEGAVHIDSTGKAPGRGAYLCANEACIGAAAKKRILDRHLKSAAPAQLYADLGAEARRLAPQTDNETDAEM
jgi:predicted RNA-binding protein YlxR (DUF448 family)